MEFLTFLKDLRRKNKMYFEIWVNIIFQYNNEKEKIINIYPNLEVHQRTFYRIIEYGINKFNDTVLGYKIEKQRGKLIIKKIEKSEKNNIKSKSLKSEQLSIFKEIISYLNEKSGNNFNHNLKIANKNITERLNEGYKLEDFKKVIDVKCKKWIGTKYEDYLTPATLFGDKFGIYVNEKLTTTKTKIEKNYETVIETTKLGWNNTPRND